jgi:hypothetical protein
LPGAPIVIEVSLPSPSETGLAVLTAACTRAALGARCLLAKDAHDEVPAAVAIVTFQTADNVRVEVGVRHGEHDVWRTSEFAFLANDDSSERWRTIGFAIGTLAESEQSSAPATDAPVAPTPSGAASSAAPSVASAEPARAAAPVPTAGPPAASVADTKESLSTPTKERGQYVDATLLLGRGLVASPLRAGGAVALDVPLPKMPLYLVGGASLTALVAERGELRTARWVDVSLGASSSVMGELGQSGLELSGQAFLERFDVSAQAFDGRSDTAGRWLFGAEGALRGSVGLTSSICLTADVRVAALSGATYLRIADGTLGEAPSLRYTAGLGLRVRVR